jgi:hypothetical protein
MAGVLTITPLQNIADACLRSLLFLLVVKEGWYLQEDGNEGSLCVSLGRSGTDGVSSELLRCV